MRELKRGENLEIDFYTRVMNPYRLPSVTSIRLNGVNICPSGSERIDESSAGGDSADGGGGGVSEAIDTSCAKLEYKTNNITGRWDGILTIYPQFSQNGLRIDLEVDAPAWALGVS